MLATPPTADYRANQYDKRVSCSISKKIKAQFPLNVIHFGTTKKKNNVIHQIIETRDHLYTGPLPKRIYPESPFGDCTVSCCVYDRECKFEC